MSSSPPDREQPTEDGSTPDPPAEPSGEMVSRPRDDQKPHQDPGRPTRSAPPDDQPAGHQYELWAYEETTSGPLPPASEFAAYNQGTPDAAERILSMAEKALEHRMEMDRREADRAAEMDRRDADRLDATVAADRAADERDSRRATAFMTRAQYLAALLVAMFVGLAVVAVIYDQPWVGGGFGGVAIIGIVTAYLGQRVDRRSSGTTREQLEASQPPPMPPANSDPGYPPDEDQPPR